MMTTILRNGVDEVAGYFDELVDPRSSINRQHPLISVVVIALMAVLAGAGGPTAIAKWAEINKELLLTVLTLPNGIPRKDVLFRELAAVVAGKGGEGHRSGPTDFRGGRQDGTAEP
jgi:hypothetical protein